MLVKWCCQVRTIGAEAKSVQSTCKALGRSWISKGWIIVNTSSTATEISQYCISRHLVHMGHSSGRVHIASGNNK